MLYQTVDTHSGWGKKKTKTKQNKTKQNKNIIVCKHIMHLPSSMLWILPTLKFLCW